MTQVVQIVGYKNTGKTTLIERLVRRLSDDGLRIGTIKHDAHQFEIDHTGTDSWRHRQAGAMMTAITSPARTAVMIDRPLSLEDLLAQMMGKDLDLVLVEGFKEAKYPKLVMVQKREHLELADRLQHVAAIVAWLPVPESRLPVFRLEQVNDLADWLQKSDLSRSASCLPEEREESASELESMTRGLHLYEYG